MQRRLIVLYISSAITANGLIGATESREPISGSGYCLVEEASENTARHAGRAIQSEHDDPGTGEEDQDLLQHLRLHAPGGLEALVARYANAGTRVAYLYLHDAHAAIEQLRAYMRSDDT